MSIIKTENLTFSYPGSFVNVFENVSFQIDTNWKLGFIGRNGRGKTTFMKLLMNEYSYNGKISASVDFYYFPFEVKDKDEMTLSVAEEVYPQLEQWELIKELNMLKVDAEVLYRPFSTLSNGEQTKVMLAVLFLHRNGFLLIDEPTNHLDEDGRKIIMNYLNRKKGFILISHDRAVLDGCIDHVLSINRLNIEVEKGNFSSWEQNKQAHDNFEISQNQKIQKKIQNLQKAKKQAAEHSDKIEKTKIGFDPSKVEKSVSRRPSIAAKSKKLMNRAKAMETRINTELEEQSKLLKEVEHIPKLRLSSLPYHSDKVLSLDKVSIAYDNRIVCENVTFDVNKGDRVALKGKNGCGKSSVLKLIMGNDIDFSGSFYKNNQLKISYVNQDISCLNGNIADYAEKNEIDLTMFHTILRKLGFSREQFTQNLSGFSAGQKKKVLIAASLCTPAHLYIWDEPLNYLDVFSRRQIEELLLDFQPTIIFVEHDSVFRNKIATKVITIEQA